ncbi:hypothetical protein H2199_008409 [Coniosporium tulheliwenetii]|uniref:Uncharacterized protein n=1 Tax=Coniosporium tulheliwenetii TaxID=3383036 RepID=A0ACC2YJP8_9PEZI|nr:hypothetical protein H2199_008409 [Cladosporium sp. JES 115]
MFVPTGNNRTNGTDATVLADDLTWDYSGIPLTYPTQYVIYSQFNIQPECSMTVTPLTVTQTEVTKVIFPVATGGLDIGTDVIGFLEGLPEFAAQFNDTGLKTCEQEVQGGRTVEYPVPSGDATAIKGGSASPSVIPEATSVPAEASTLPLIKPRLPIPVGPRTAALEFPGAGNYTLYGRQATGTGGTGVTPLPTRATGIIKTTTMDPNLPENPAESTFSGSFVISFHTSDSAVPPLPPPTSTPDPHTTPVASTLPAGNSGARAGTHTTVAVLTEATAAPSTSTFTRSAGGRPPTPIPPMQVNTPPGSSIRPVNPSQPPNPSQNPNPNPNPGPSNPPDNRPTNPGGIIGSLLNPSPSNGGNSPGPTAGGNPSNNPGNNSPNNNPNTNPNNNVPNNNNPGSNNPSPSNPGSNNPRPGQSITIGPGPPVVITPAPTSQGGSRPGGIIIGPGSTLLPGQSTNINGVPVVLGPSGSNLVIGGSSTVAIQPGAPNTNPTRAPAQTVAIGTGAPIVPGQTTTINGVPVVAGPSGTNLIIGGTRTVAVASGPAATGPQVLTVAGATITANPSGAFVLAPGTTLTPGGPALTLSGTTLSLGPSGSVLVVNGVSQTLAPGAAITPPPALLVIGTRTLTATTIGSVTGFVVAPGTTLTPGGAVTLAGTTFSLPSASGAGGPTVVVVNGRTSTLSAATGPITAAPVLTIDGTTFAPTVAGGSTFYVVSGSTLRPGGVVTVDGTRISLGPEGTVLVIGGVTSTASRPARNSATATMATRSEDVGDFVASGIGISSADGAVGLGRGGWRD